MDKKNQKKNYGGIQESPFNKGAGTRSVTGGSLKDNNGITLIALVITIIVMLILVSVTISMAVNGGLFEYAQKAGEETNTAINAEQTLANGKIKIGGKWYASIDDYINNNPIETGIEITPTEVTLKKKESEEVEGEEVLTQNITASVFGMETEPEITWEVTPEDQTAIELSATTGKTITVTAVGTEKATATITAKCTYEGEEYTETRDVTLEIIKKPVEVARGDFVYYDVEYTDVYYDTYEYTNTNGWRLLHYDTDKNGNLYNVELISTGIPARLYYYNTSYSATGNNKWWVTDKTTEFQIALQNYYGDGTSSYEFYSDTGENVYATAGLYYNFANIPFYTESNYSNLSSSSKYNVGWYRNIVVNGKMVEKNMLGSDLFVTSNDYRVRCLTLPEINNDAGADSISTTHGVIPKEPAKGLYILENIDDVLGFYKYSYTDRKSLSYCLASPYISTSFSVYCAYHYGVDVGFITVGDNYNPFGVRPVVQFRTDTYYAVESDVDDSGIEYLILTPVS